MQKRTKGVLKLFEETDLLSRVGIKESYIAAWSTTWADAARSFCTLEWEGVQFAASNQLRMKRFLLCRGRFESGEYNNVLREVKKAARSLVDKKIQDVLGALEEHKNIPHEVRKQSKLKPLVQSPLDKLTLAERFALEVHTHIWAAAMEAEYADVQPPGFFSCLAFWYLKGHFPCGWQDDGRKKVKVSDGFRYEWPDIYPPGFYDPIAKWYEKGDFGNWQGQVPRGKLIVY